MRCPTPAKVRYRSRRAARRALVEIHTHRKAGLGRLHAYRCKGHWHVGHI